MNDKIKYIIISALIIFMMIAYYFMNKPKNIEVIQVDNTEAFTNNVSSEVTDDSIEQQNVVNEEPKDMKVYISGEVVNPGVYNVTEDTRLIDVLEMAGGATDEADLDSVNLASYVEDAQQINIPKIGEVDTLQSQNISETNNNSKLININTATKEELMTLPAIGDVKADSIIEYRTSNGGFDSIDELKNVSGIGDKTFEGLQDLITI